MQQLLLQPIAQKLVLGNATTASKLATARNIALTGAVSGNANFDGSGNITISTKQVNTAILTGKISNGTGTITYPSGYTKDNCTVISKMFQRATSSSGFSDGTAFLPADGTLGSVSSRITLNSNGIAVTLKHLYLSSDGTIDMTINYDINYKIVLMKIS